MATTMKAEQLLLEQIQTIPLVGLVLFDHQSKLKIEMVLDDPQFRDMLVEYQRERVRQLELSEQSTNSVKSYPTLH